jgi:hypothetical protein
VDPLPTLAQPARPAEPTAGWNGNHFFLRSTDGQFQLSPVGYVWANYAVYSGGGAPPNGFAIKRARFGFQGSYGKNVEYVMIADAAATGSVLRDAYVKFKAAPELQIQAGQFVEPFAQEVAGTSDPNIEFFDRSITSALYPSATSSYRSPGAMVFGDVHGVLQYWVGAFNGRGIGNPSASNWPEVISRVRVWPLRWAEAPALRRLALGGSVGYARAVAISQDQSFSGALNDAAYTFFPTFAINGPVQRYGADAMWLSGPLGVRAEYVELHQARDGIGGGALMAGGFENLPAVFAQGAYAQLTYLLTGETEEDNAAPKVRHPVFGPAGEGVDGAGAWQIAARVGWLHARAPGATFGTFTPTAVPTYEDSTDQLTLGLNWYLNDWTVFKLDLNVDQLQQPSVQGMLPQNYYVVIQQLSLRF